MMPRYSVTVERSESWRFDVEAPTAEEAQDQAVVAAAAGDTINADKIADNVEAVEVVYMGAYGARGAKQ